MDSKINNPLVAGALVSKVFYFLPGQLLIPEQINIRWVVGFVLIIAHLFCAYGLIKNKRSFEVCTMILTLYYVVTSTRALLIHNVGLGGDSRLVAMLLPGILLDFTLFFLLVFSFVTKKKYQELSKNRKDEQVAPSNGG